jgi:hypothetical protein
VPVRRLHLYRAGTAHGAALTLAHNLETAPSILDFDFRFFFFEVRIFNLETERALRGIANLVNAAFTIPTAYLA